MPYTDANLSHTENPRTLEQIEEDFRHKVFGKCKRCGKWFWYGEEFINVSKGICGSSQGTPCAYIDECERYHLSCFTNSIT